MPATRSSWKHLPAPAAREDLGFEALFTDADAEQMCLGLVPERMEDKWFVYYEDGWLRFHRSWTGAYIYALRLDGSPMGVRVVESWVNRDPEQYTGTDTEYDRRLVRYLIDALLLGRPDPSFPMPAGVQSAPLGLVQHAYVGRSDPPAPRTGGQPPDERQMVIARLLVLLVVGCTLNVVGLAAATGAFRLVLIAAGVLLALGALVGLLRARQPS